MVFVLSVASLSLLLTAIVVSQPSQDSLQVEHLLMISRGSFLTEYCISRNIRSVNVVLPNTTGEEEKMVELLLQLSDHGIRTSVGSQHSTNGLDHTFSLTALEFRLETAAFIVRTLTQAGEDGGFRPGRRWLVMTSSRESPTLLMILERLPMLIDSDFIMGVVHTSGHIILQEVYTTGLHGVQRVLPIGEWQEGCSRIITSSLSSYKYTRRKDLLGLELKAVNKFYTVIRKDGNNVNYLDGGYVANIFKTLQADINVTVSINVLPGYAYGQYHKQNGSWSGLVGELQRGNADITACELSSTPERIDDILFSQPFQIIRRRLYFRRPGLEFRGDAFLRPFSWSIWLLLLLSLPVVAGVALVLGRLAPESYEPPSRGLTFTSHLFGVIAALLMQGSEVYADTPRRMLMWTLYISYLVVSVSYSAKMVAIRTTERSNLPFTDLPTILHRPDWHFGFVGPALERTYFETAEPMSVLGRLWGSWVTKNPKNLVPDVDTGLTRALSSKFAFLCIHQSCQDALMNRFPPQSACDLHALPSIYFKGGISFGLSKNSPFKELLDYRMMSMRQYGLFSRLASDAFPRMPACSSPPFRYVGVLDVAPALMVLGAGCMLGLVLLWVECVLACRIARKTKHVHMA